MNTITSPIQWIRNCLLVVALAILTSCSGGGTTAGGVGTNAADDASPSGSSASPTVPPTLFPGGEQQKPAALLTFTSDVRAISVTPDGSKLYVGDVLHNTVSAIDVESRKVMRVIDVNTGPRYITVTPDGTRAFVANYGARDDNAGNTVSVIQVADDRVIATVEVGLRPFALAAAPDSSKVYVANVGSSSVSVIDVKTLDVATIDNVGMEPVSIVVTHNGDKAFVANRGSNDVAVIDTATNAIIHTEPVQTKPTGLALLPDDSRLLVTNRDSNSVSVIDVEAGRVQKTLGVGEGPMAVAVSPDGKRAYVANAFGDREDDACRQDEADPSEFGNTLSVIDLETNAVLPGQIEVGRAPLGVVITGAGDKLYALSACDPQVAKVDTNSISHTAAVVAEQIPVVARGTAITIDQGSSTVYVAHPHAVSVIDIATDRVVGVPIPVRGAGPTRLAMTSNGTKLYAIHPGTDSVSVFNVSADSEQLVDSLIVGSRPSTLTLTTDDAQLLVTNSGFSRTPDQRISVIDVATDVVETIPLIDLDPDTNQRVGRGPIDLAVPPSTSISSTKVFVANFGDFFPNNRKPGKFISIISSDTRSVDENNGDYGAWPVTVVIDPKAVLNKDSGNVSSSATDDVVYVADYFDSKVIRGQVSDPSVPTVFLLGDLFREERVSGPVGIALDADHNAYVATYMTVNKSIGDTPTDLTQIIRISADQSAVVLQPVRGPSPNKIILAPDGATAWILHAGDRSLRCGPANDVFCEVGNTVSVLSLAAIPLDAADVPSLTVGKRPADIAFANGKAYVSNYFDDTVSIIDTSVFPPTVLEEPIAVGNGPEGVMVNPAGDRVYVANSTSNTISVIDVSDDTVIRTIEISPQPF